MWAQQTRILLSGAWNRFTSRTSTHFAETSKNEGILPLQTHVILIFRCLPQQKKMISLPIFTWI
jgi:hypothetical protein